MLDYGYRSKCCYAALRMGTKKLRKGGKTRVWVCTACGTADVQIVPKGEGASQINKKFATTEYRYGLEED